jgi:hypothetical protein
MEMPDQGMETVFTFPQRNVTPIVTLWHSKEPTEGAQSVIALTIRFPCAGQTTMLVAATNPAMNVFTLTGE